MKDDVYIDFGINYEVLDDFMCEFVMEVTNQAVNSLSRKQCAQFMEWFNHELDKCCM